MSSSSRCLNSRTTSCSLLAQITTKEAAVSAGGLCPLWARASDSRICSSKEGKTGK